MVHFGVIDSSGTEGLRLADGGLDSCPLDVLAFLSGVLPSFLVMLDGVLPPVAEVAGFPLVALAVTPH